MKKITTLFSYLSILAIYSCNYKLRPGMYVDNVEHSSIELKSGFYHYKTIGDVHSPYKFSKGQYFWKKGFVSFIPDSNYLFRIRLLKLAYDPSLGEKRRKIILRSQNKDIARFKFSLLDGASSKDFNNDLALYYEPTSGFQFSFVLKAILIDDNIVPRMIYDSLISNPFDITKSADNFNENWNVLELDVSISRDMFAYIKLPDYAIRKKTLYSITCPMFELKK